MQCHSVLPKHRSRRIVWSSQDNGLLPSAKLKLSLIKLSFEGSLLRRASFCSKMGSTEKYCLKWNDYRSNISLAFQDLRNSSDFCDVTLATDEAEFQAHRVILSACSPHLRDLLKRHSPSNNQNLLIYLRGVRHSDLTSILEFMYNGEVNVAQDDLTSFLAVAEDLKVKGLTQELGGSHSGNQQQSQSSNDKSAKPKVTLTPSTKNGGSTSNSSGQPPVKRAKQELVRIKQEEVAKQVFVFPNSYALTWISCVLSG